MSLKEINLSSEGATAAWAGARPVKVAESAFWPATLGLGATLLVWGLVVSIIIAAVGLLVFAASLAGWIGDIRRERRARCSPSCIEVVEDRGAR